MKIASTLIGTTVWLLLTLGMVSQTQAIPVTYTYVGSTYTQTTLPGVPGLTLNDRITASMIIDSVSWGTESGVISGNMNSGPYSLFDAGRVMTDPAGAVLAWNLSGSAPGKDMASGGRADGSGLDIIFGDTFVEPHGTFLSGALVNYQAGSRVPSSSWSIVGVPDVSSTLALLSLSLIPLLCFWHSQFKQEATRGGSRQA
jgi:hypothetical protein